MRITSMVLLSALLATTSVGGQTPAARTPAGIAESFLNRIAKQDIAAAYDELFRGGPMSGRADQIALLKKQTEALLPLYGQSLGFELYRQDKYGEHLVRLLYVQRLQKHPVVWKFWVYNPGGTWQVNAITFNDQFVFE